jgi:tRNA dimethylallyltransferase
MRALEVYKATGKSILHFRTRTKLERPFRIIKIALDIPKEQLHQNIAQRVNAMIEQGLLAEVQSLLPFRHLNALQTVGYKEMFAYLNGDSLFEEAVEAIKRNTRQYAKRQLTWFKKDEGFTWMPAANKEAINAYADQMLKQ